MKKPTIEGTESLAFTDRESATAKVEDLRRDGVKHVSRRTDQVDGHMLWIVSWPKSEDLRTVLEQAENFVKNMETEESEYVLDK